jgi:phosphoribosylanthranilate isomerase
MTEIKICGLTNIDDARSAIELGADYLGFVLYKKSPRGITFSTLLKIVDKLDYPCRIIPVFVNESALSILKMLEEIKVYAIQLHGEESVHEFCNIPVPVWRAVRWEGNTWSPLPEKWKAIRYVVDSRSEESYGGTGKLANWSAAGELARKYQIMLAGGLTPENVTSAIHAVHPVGVDVSSGIELHPGKKDITKMKKFIYAVRNMETQKKD